MRKFNFRLEPVLKYREIAEEQAAVKQVAAREEYLQNEDKLRDARNKLAGAAQDNQVLNPFDMFNRLVYCDYMTGEVQRWETALKQSAKKLAMCRANLVKAVQERSVMEKLREKHFNNYSRDVSSAEQKQNDETAVIMHYTGSNNKF